MTTPVKTTVINTDQCAKTEFDWGTTCWCINQAEGNSADLTFGKVMIRPGQCNPSHRHTNCEEVLYLLEGQLDHHADDLGTVRMGPGDVILIPKGVAHNATCASEEPAVMIVVYSSPDRHVEHV